MIGKMDPYLELSIGGVQIHKTATLDGAGKTPAWNEECAFEVKDLGAEVHFKVSDEDYGKDDVVGEGSFSLADWCNEAGTDSSYEIKFNGKGAGTVHFSTTYVDFKAARESEADRL